MIVKRKLDGTVDESSADKKIHRLDATVRDLSKSGGLHIAKPGFTAGWLTKFRRGLKFLKLAVDQNIIFSLCLAKLLHCFSYFDAFITFFQANIFTTLFYKV